jgi:hypothetical protein
MIPEHITMERLSIYKLLTIGLILSALVGCAVTQPQKVPHDVLHLRDNEFNRDYFVYLPTTYGKGPLPLVVTCHGTNPWDSARLQINEWKYMAEQNNFVVIAPFIDSARGYIPPSPPEGTQILENDEKFVLKIVRRFLNSPNIDSRSVMITGWSAGGFATYYIGLRHPDIFRVVVGRQANFVKEYYPNDIWWFNPYQPLMIFYGTADLPLIKADAQVAYRFFQDAGQKNIVLKSVSGGHSRHPELALEYFQECVKIYPKPTIISAKMYSGGKCRVKFDSGLVGPVNDDDIFWDFGDGDSAPGRVVEHIYNRPGKFQLAVMHTYHKQTIRFIGRVEINSHSLSFKTGGKR